MNVASLRCSKNRSSSIANFHIETKEKNWANSVHNLSLKKTAYQHHVSMHIEYSLSYLILHLKGYLNRFK